MPDTLAALHVDPETGLKLSEVESRRRLYGFNEVAEQKTHPILGALALYLDFLNLFLILLRLVGNRRQ